MGTRPPPQVGGPPDMAVDPAVLPLIGAIRRFSERAVELGDHMRDASEVNATDFRALTHVQAQPGLTAGQLGELLGRSPAAVSTILDRLEDVGHMERRPDPDDRRRVTLWVTERPQRVAAAALSPLVRRLDEEFDADDPADLAELAAGIDRVADVLADFMAAARSAHDGVGADT